MDSDTEFLYEERERERGRRRERKLDKRELKRVEGRKESKVVH